MFFSSPVMCIHALEDLRAIVDEIFPPIAKDTDRNVASDLWGRLENALQRYSMSFVYRLRASSGARLRISLRAILRNGGFTPMLT